jgi:hypothetical protein
MTGSQLKSLLSAIIDSLVLDKYPSATDDMHADILSDGENREEAIDTLVKMIENYRDIL